MHKTLTAMALVTGLLLSSFSAGAVEATAPVRAIILPFKNLTTNAEDNWLGESFSETLTTGLAPIRSLQLVERSQINKIMQEQAFTQTGLVDDQSAPQMGKLVGAKVVVLGSYQKVGTELSVNARFVDVETGKIDATVMAQVEGPYSELFSLQKKLADQLIKNLSITATEQEAKQIENVMFARKSTLAYEYYSKGKSKSMEGTDSALAEAIKWYHKALIEDTDYALAYAGLAEAFATRARVKSYYSAEAGDAPKALEFAQKAVNLNSILPETHRALGWAYFANGNQANALDHMRMANQMKPNDSEMITAYVAVKHGQTMPEPDVLKNELRQMGANLDDPWIQFTVIQACAWQARTKAEFQHAIQAYSELQTKLPNYFYIPLSLAFLYMQTNQMDQAKAAIERALQLDPDNFLALYTASTLLSMAGDKQQAKINLLKIIKQKPDFPWSYLSLISIYNDLDEPEKALMMYKYGSQQLPNNPSMMMAAAGVYRKQKKYDEAQALLEQSLSAANTHSQGVAPDMIHEQLALIYQLQHKYEKALGHYQSMNSTQAFKAKAMRKIAALYHQQDKPTEALQSYTAFLQQFPDEAKNPEYQQQYREYHLLHQFNKNPQDAQALNDLGQLALNHKTPDLAQVYLKQAIMIAPTNPVIQYNLGCLYLQTREWSKAQAAFEKAVELKADYANAWFNLALVYLQIDQTVQAQTALKKVLTLVPQHPQATKALDALNTKKS